MLNVVIDQMSFIRFDYGRVLTREFIGYNQLGRP
jgi:hypothetical protein